MNPGQQIVCNHVHEAIKDSAFDAYVLRHILVQRLAGMQAPHINTESCKDGDSPGSTRLSCSDTGGGCHGCCDTSLFCLKCGQPCCQRKPGVTTHCGQTLLVDGDRLELFCTDCSNYMFCKEFDQQAMIAMASYRTHQGAEGAMPSFDPASRIYAKRRTLRELLTSKEHTASSPRQDTWADVVASDGLPLGLRGLNNLGNTCFMNSVLQAVLHAPLLRNFYLGDGHHPARCGRKSSRPCLSCQMAIMFSEAYSGHRAPFSPVQFLFGWWGFADSLAGYSQQDAHEFYLSLLAALANSHISPLSPSVSAENMDGAGGTDPATTPLADTPSPTVTDSLRMLNRDGPSWLRALEGSTDSPSSEAGTSPHDGDAGWEAALSGSGRASPSLGASWLAASRDRSDSWLEDAPGRESPAVSPTNSHGEEMECMVERAFGGLLRSDVTCCRCGHTSTAFDPFLDISLDIPLEDPPPVPPPLGDDVGTAVTPSPTPPPSDPDAEPPPRTRRRLDTPASSEPEHDSLMQNAGMVVTPEATPPTWTLTRTPSPGTNSMSLSASAAADGALFAARGAGPTYHTQGGSDSNQSMQHLPRLPSIRTCIPAVPTSGAAGLENAPRQPGAFINAARSAGPSARSASVRQRAAGLAQGNGGGVGRPVVTLRPMLAATSTGDQQTGVRQLQRLASGGSLGRASETNGTGGLEDSATVLGTGELGSALTGISSPEHSSHSSLADAHARRSEQDALMMDAGDPLWGLIQHSAAPQPLSREPGAQGAPGQRELGATHGERAYNRGSQASEARQGGGPDSQVRKVVGRSGAFVAFGGSAEAAAPRKRLSSPRSDAGPRPAPGPRTAAAIWSMYKGPGLPGGAPPGGPGGPVLAGFLQQQLPRTKFAPAHLRMSAYGFVAGPPGELTDMMGPGSSSGGAGGSGANTTGSGGELLVEDEGISDAGQDMSGAVTESAMDDSYSSGAHTWMARGIPGGGSTVTSPALRARGRSRPRSLPVGGGRGRNRPQRCGECYTCLNKHLKKGCLRNKGTTGKEPPREPLGLQTLQAAPSAPLPLPVMSLASPAARLPLLRASSLPTARHSTRDSRGRFIKKGPDGSGGLMAMFGGLDELLLLDDSLDHIEQDPGQDPGLEPDSEQDQATARDLDPATESDVENGQVQGEDTETDPELAPELVLVAEPEPEPEPLSMHMAALDWLRRRQHELAGDASAPSSPLLIESPNLMFGHAGGTTAHEAYTPSLVLAGAALLTAPSGQPLRLSTGDTVGDTPKRATVAAAAGAADAAFSAAVKLEEAELAVGGPLSALSYASPFATACAGYPRAGADGSHVFKTEGQGIGTGLLLRRALVSDGAGDGDNVPRLSRLGVEGKHNVAASGMAVGAGSGAATVPVAAPAGVAVKVEHGIKVEEWGSEDEAPGPAAAGPVARAVQGSGARLARRDPARGRGAGGGRWGRGASGRGSLPPSSNVRQPAHHPSHEAVKPVSLLSCLRRFVRAERLSPCEAWVCAHCRRQQPATKQLSVRRLPPLLCLHLKRFEQSGRHARKLDVPVTFPLSGLDMSPFVTCNVLRERYACRSPLAQPPAGSIAEAPPPAVSPATAAAAATAAALDTGDFPVGSDEELRRKASYDLFAVISHRGDLKGGHYVAYVRAGAQWYQCDDAWVTHVTPEHVSACQAYMLFYAQSEFYGSEGREGGDGKGAGLAVGGAGADARPAGACTSKPMSEVEAVLEELLPQQQYNMQLSPLLNQPL